MGNSTRRFKKPAGIKSIFASRTSPINHADKVAVMAVRYMAGFPFRLKIKNTMSIRNTKNSRIVKINQRDIFQHVPITSRKPVMPDSKGVPGFFAFWGSSRILMNPGAS